MTFRFAFKASFGHLQDVLARCLACLGKTSCRCLFADWEVVASEDEHDETKLLHITSQLKKCYL